MRQSASRFVHFPGGSWEDISKLTREEGMSPTTLHNWDIIREQEGIGWSWAAAARRTALLDLTKPGAPSHTRQCFKHFTNNNHLILTITPRNRFY